MMRTQIDQGHQPTAALPIKPYRKTFPAFSIAPPIAFSMTLLMVLAICVMLSSPLAKAAAATPYIATTDKTEPGMTTLTELQKTLSQQFANVRVEGYKPSKSVMPDYPAAALLYRIEGYVAVQFDIAPTGQAVNPRILESSPTLWFDATALEAIGQFYFSPQLVDGKGVSVEGVVSKFVFELQPALPKPGQKQRTMLTNLISD